MKIDLALTPIRRFARFLNEERKEVYAIYFYTILNGLVSLSLPLGIQAILNFILGGRISTSWILLVVVVGAGISFGGFLQISQLYLTEKLQQRIFTKAGFGFAYRLPRLKLDSLQDKHTPDLVNRFFDAINLQKGMAKILIDFSAASIQVFFGLVLLAFYHPFFIIFGFILISLLILIFYFTSPKGMETSLDESTSKYKVAYWLEEIGRTMATFKLAGTSKLPFMRVDKLLESYVDFRNKHFAILIFQYKILIAFKVLIVCSLLVAGSLLLINNEISIGQFVAAEIIIVLVVNSVEKLILTLETVYDTLTATEKIGQILDLPVERQEGTDKSLTEEFKGLEFKVKNVTYQSRDTQFNILDNVSLDLKTGDKVILTGTSGSGKSTLMYLLAGLYSDYKGKILVNGLPIETMNLDKFRSFIGDSLTHQSIFHGTIYENITLGKEVAIQQIRDIIELVGLKEYIYALKDDIDTGLMPEGKGLSKKIISKIIMARCLAGNPKALILEDLFSYFDNTVKERVAKYILEGPWTTVMVSDDISLLKKAPRIIELSNGKVAFDGPSEAYFEYKNL
ncbi:ABC-type bacteriocin/lantibiotic exporter with N-terminal double-glycine peptidase domain [Belliella baltica DSM 15883]|uniref:ABC-type bacteriocin/lantibiotic exporter with N-terminal double-glycine peptidase domain n=1 Tax=Belliella baltica (strain DSM 15883 / CIP 108006 / LMG 21964 / BA134) TaxID=866536 RepID=I3Z7E9_BELBD|nr:ATP-binding cassette domain-containing protein [Belliella baltica]AFL85167.1 ABC-type bacteriocin/lantibiotic exporter with N-terminal double-glycine peptidase domain [Belliella baltica DSM 15883]